MAKPALGKGLGQLMTGQPAVGKAQAEIPAGSTLPGKVTPVDFGRGLNTLVGTATAPAVEEAPQAKEPIPAWFYFAADILLLAYTVAITFDAQPFDWGSMLFCAVSVSAGALLGVAGVLRSSFPK